MTTEPKVADLPGKLRARAARLHGQTAGADLVADELEECAKDIEAALSRQDAQPEDWGPSHKQPWHEAEDAQPEQQGAVDVDGLARIIREVDSAHSLGASALAEAILSRVPSIAARQPVGQEPVMWRYFSPHANCYWTRDVKPTSETSQDGTQWEPLYAAPPAQVDLEQFRTPVEVWQSGTLAHLRELGAKDHTQIIGTWKVALKANLDEANRLLALIDQQAGKVGG